MQPGETVIIVTLCFMSGLAPIYKIINTHFGGDARPWGKLVSKFVTMTTHVFYNKISGRSLKIYSHRLEQYARVVANFVSSQTEYVETINQNDRLVGSLHHVIVCPQECRCIGFIDDTFIVTR